MQLLTVPDTPMTPAEVKSIRDAVGGTKAMAERLDITELAVRSLLQNGAIRKSTVNRLKALAGPKGRRGAA